MRVSIMVSILVFCTIAIADTHGDQQLREKSLKSHVRRDATTNRCDDNVAGEKVSDDPIAGKIYLLRVIFTEDHWVRSNKGECRWMYVEEDGTYATIANGSFAVDSMFGSDKPSYKGDVHEFVEYESKDPEMATVPFSCKADAARKLNLWVRNTPTGALRAIPVEAPSDRGLASLNSNSTGQ